MAAILANFCGSPVYMVKLRAFIFGSVMHLYWGYPQGKNYASVNNILKVMTFFKENSHFALFSSFGIHAKDTNFIFGILQTYTCTDTQTCTHIDTHMYRDIDTQIQIHRDICMFVYKHTHTH